MIKLLVYVISVVLSVFAINGININAIFKKNHVVEARIFILLLIISMTYLVANFILDLTSINLMP